MIFLDYCISYRFSHNIFLKITNYFKHCKFSFNQQRSPSFSPWCPVSKPCQEDLRNFQNGLIFGCPFNGMSDIISLTFRVIWFSWEPCFELSLPEIFYNSGSCRKLTDEMQIILVHKHVNELCHRDTIDFLSIEKMPPSIII